jgi:GTP-binding protein
VKESDLLLFLIDDTVGITAKEQHILDLIRREKKQNATILVVNKLDVKRKESETPLALAEYYDLGIATVIGISAKTERNLDELQEYIDNTYKTRKKQHPMEPLDKEVAEGGGSGLAILGKPNA